MPDAKNKTIDEKDILKNDLKKELEKLSLLQMQLKENNKGLIVVVDGWGCSGKGNLVNKLIDKLDSKFYKVENMQDPTKEELRRPFITRYFEKIPEIGKICIFDASWLNDLAKLKARKKIDDKEYQDKINSIKVFEKQLIDNDYIIVKLFLDLKEKEQAKRIKKLLSSTEDAWRVSSSDIYENEHYDNYKSIFEDIMSKTNKKLSKWHIIEQGNKKETTLKALKIINKEIEHRFHNRHIPSLSKDKDIKLLKTTKLSEIDLKGKTIEEDEYKTKVKELQKELKVLHDKLYQRKIPVIIAYEGWDAAGKGGNIKRISKSLDPRGFEIFPIASPTAEEKNKHYLWRFWNKIPKTGHISIFDRTWYGRVMVERLEGFCSENDWQRAFNEINEFENELTKWGAIVVKFWVQIDKETQLERFTIRQNTPEKQWKITDEDWRNRDKWDDYEIAINEMIEKTNTDFAPWYVLESNDKKYARIKALETLISIFKKKLEECEK